MRVYISGPMSGYENHNYEAFHAAATRIRESGFDVLCPAENFNGDTSLSYDVYMRQDLVLLSICDAIAMLPGWEHSGGALCELHAALTIGLPVFDAETMEPLYEGTQIVTRGLVGFIMWRKELHDQQQLSGYRDQRENEEREDYTGILATAGVGGNEGFFRGPNSQGLEGTRYLQGATSSTVS